MSILETIGIVTTRAFLAFLVFTLGVVIASVCKKLVRQSLAQLRVNRAIALLNYPYDLEGIAAIFTFYVVYIASIAVTFWLLGIGTFMVWLLLFIFVMALTFSVVSFAKDFLPNVYGLYKAKRVFHIKKGSRINFPKVSGVVQKIGLVDTIVKTSNGDLLHVPNVLFWKS